MTNPFVTLQRILPVIPTAAQVEGTLTRLRAWNASTESLFGVPNSQSVTSPSPNGASSALAQALLMSASQEWSTDILAEYLRVAKNVLRYRLQFMASQEEESPLASTHMLTVYAARSSVDDETKVEACRHASLCLFYATFGVPTLARKRLWDFLVADLQYLKLLQNILTSPHATTSVLLAQMRLLHSLIVSRSSLVKHVRSHEISATLIECPWSTHLKHQTDDATTTMMDLLVALLEWCISDINKDRRKEVAIELLRVLYAMKVTSLERTLLDKLLGGDVDLQQSTIMLLMDIKLPEPPLEWKEVLWSNLERNLDTVVASERISPNVIGGPAAAALTPILAVLTKCCQTSSDYLTATKEFVWKNQEGCTPVNQERINNMLPSDAPKATLRWKCIQLLQWPESTLKRLAGEFLFLLCDANAQLYIKRVGMGNAIPILSAKGLVDMSALTAAAATVESIAEEG